MLQGTLKLEIMAKYLKNTLLSTDIQNAHFRAAAAADLLTCEVVRVDIQRHADQPRLDRRIATLRFPPNPAESICEFVALASKCQLLDVQPPHPLSRLR